MRSRYKFGDGQNQLYFVTLTVIEKIPVFTNSRYMDVLIENLEFYRKNEGLKIFYYVIMDNHTHMIISHEKNVGGILKNYKSYTAKKILECLKNDERRWILYLMEYYKKQYKTESKYQFWQEGSYPKLIQSCDMLRQKVDYIHFNPVKRGLVLEPEDWLYSSARNFSNRENVFELDEIEL